MAQFSLSLINNRGTTVLTDYDTMAGKTAGLTFDEHLNLNVDGSTLDFSMLKYLYEGSKKVVNTPTISITYGSIIKCLHNGHRYDFAITDISYQFLPQNLQLTFSAQDYFQFETSKLGIGYTITGDTTDPDYFGAQPIDAWAQKIVRDNNLRWGYIPINQANREWINLSLTAQQKDATFTVDASDDGSTYWQVAESEYTLNQWVSFECSDSTAYNALKQLASENGLMIAVDYSNQNFWFIPQQNVVFNGYYFNPNNNLQQFSLRGSAQNLVTVLNITGPKDLNNQEITLVPKFPTEIVQWIASNDWDASIYYPNLYDAHVNSDYKDANAFLREVQYAPWLENKLIDFSFFTDNNLLMSSEAQQIQDILYNKLRIINAHLIVENTVQLNTYGEQYKEVMQTGIDTEALSAQLNADVDGINTLVYSNTAPCFATQVKPNEPWIYWPNGYALCGPYGEVTVESLDQESGAYSGYLYCPETEGVKTLIKLTPQLGSFSIPLEVTDRSRNPNGSEKTYTFPLFQINNNNLQYNGHALGSKSGWSIDRSETATLDPHELILRTPTWCKESVFSINQTGNAAKSIRIYYLSSAVAVSCNIGSGWSTLKCISDDEDSSYYDELDGHIWYETNNPYHVHIQPNLRGTYTGLDAAVRQIQDDNVIIWKNNNDTVCKTIPVVTDSVLSFKYHPEVTDVTLYLSVGNNTQQVTNADTIIVAADSYRNWTNCTSQLKNSYDSTKLVKHVRLLPHAVTYGSFTVYGKCSVSNGSDIFTNNLTFSNKEGDITSPYLFKQLSVTEQYTKPIPITAKPSVVEIDQLNQLCGIRNNYIQTLGTNCYELLTLWDTVYNTLSIGSAALKFQNVAILSDDEQDIIVEGSQYYEGAPATESFDQNDLDFFYTVFNLSPAEPLLRTRVVAYIQQITSNITERWNNCHAAAMGLGIYWPADWNNSKWLIQNQDRLSEIYDLVQSTSPLVIRDFAHPPITMTDLMFNINLMPINNYGETNEYIWNGTTPQEIILVSNLNSSAVNISINNIGTYNNNNQSATQQINYVLTPGQEYTFELEGMIIHPTLPPAHCGLSYTITYDTNNHLIKLTINALHGYPGFDSNMLTVTTNHFDYSDLKPQETVYNTYQFVDGYKLQYHPFEAAIDNTQLRPTLLSQSEDNDNAYMNAYNYHINMPDKLELYKIPHHIRQEQCRPHLAYTVTPAQILTKNIPDSYNYDAQHYQANPILYNIYSLAARKIYDTKQYYNYLKQHDEIWRGLYQDYPGVFRESTYVNDTAASSQELYVAAKAQLDSLSKPSYEYSLTGMDIYMHDSDYVPTRLKLGEQIRIDYQDPDQITDTLNAAIREPLYVTGISHALRNDGDYQFTVTTRTATDTMVQRFAQLLSFGR